MKTIENYGGKKIIIETIEGTHNNNSHEHDHHDQHHQNVRLTIDNREIHVMIKPNGRYLSHYLPYRSFSSVLELAKALVDCVLLFRK